MNTLFRFLSITSTLLVAGCYVVTEGMRSDGTYYSQSALNWPGTLFLIAVGIGILFFNRNKIAFGIAGFVIGGMIGNAIGTALFNGTGGEIVHHTSGVSAVGGSSGVLWLGTLLTLLLGAIGATIAASFAESI